MMMKKRVGGEMLLVLLAMVLFIAEPGLAAVDCGQVKKSLSPCLSYLTGGALSPACCTGVSNLKSMATGTADRRAACECLKAAASQIPAIHGDRAASLPRDCHVDVGIPISKNIRCSDIP